MAASRTGAIEAATFLVIVTCWGFNYVFVRWGLALAVPLWLAFGRAAVGAAAVILLLAFLPAEGRPKGRRAVLGFALGVPNTALFFGLWFLAASRVAPGEAAVLVYTYPLWVALFAVPILGERIRSLTAIALVVGFSGVALVAEPWRGGSSFADAPSTVELLAAAAAWGVGTVLMQRTFAAHEMQWANGLQLAGGSTGLLIGVALVGAEPLPTPSVPLLGVLVWLGIAGTAIAYALWYRLLGRLPATTLSAYAFLVPVVALAASALLLGETLVLAQGIGVVLVLAAIFLVGRARAQEAPLGTASSPDGAG